MAELKLWYFFEGEDRYDIVRISRDKLVVDLQEEIHQGSNKSYCKDVTAGDLVLLKVDIDSQQYVADDAVHKLRAPDSATKMNVTTRIQDLWPEGPIEAHFHICVRLRRGPARKRPRIEDDDAGEYLNSCLARLAPSTVAKPSVVRRIQNQPSDRVANDRPNSDAEHLPIALLYHGFGHFLDVANGASTDDILNIDRPQFESSVDDFMGFMNLYYYSEMDRSGQALCNLNDIFKHCLGGDTRPLTTGTDFPKLCSSGRALGPANTTEVVLQVKSELGSSDEDPTIQVSAHYTHSLKEDSTKEVISHFLFPALGIVVIGSYVGFYALAYEKRTRLVALTPLLPTTAESGNNWVKPALLNAFRAASVLRYHIHEDTKKFCTTKKESFPISKNLPYVSEVPAYSSPSVASTSPCVIHFHIQREAYQGVTRYANRFLYYATLDSPDNPYNELRLDKLVIVKFTRRYFPELHSFCASKGCAPQLLGYGTIPGGWKVVVMEWIDQRDTNLQLHSRDHLPTWSKDLKALVNDFHDKGWVHGDLRDANFMVSDEEPGRVMLIDFDWGGNVDEGPVYYPTARVNEELMKPGGRFDFRITKEHDDYVLASTLEKLKKQIT